jgi:uncharacterized protein YcfJ
MKPFFKAALTAVAAVLASQAMAQITFYEHDNFQGRTFSTERQVNNFDRAGFNDRASSVIVEGERWSRWEVCDDIRFAGRCVVLRPGRYESLRAMGLNDRVSSVKPVGRNARVTDERLVAPPLASQVIFYENEGFQGRTFTANEQVDNFSQVGFNDRASSAVVLGQRWEVCNDSGFNGQCMVLNPGRYPSLRDMGLNDRISSVRAVAGTARLEERRFAPAPVAVYDSRPREDERLFEARVTSVRAVVGPAEQRCWVEREEVGSNRGDPNVGGAVVGALLGGILGHQVGGGLGKDIATVGGVVAGAAIGSNVGRDNNGQPTTREVQRCATRPSNAAPAFWDVSYNFRGTDHRIQMTAAPGPTIRVNARGEPRS